MVWGMKFNLIVYLPVSGKRFQANYKFYRSLEWLHLTWLSFKMIVKKGLTFLSRQHCNSSLPYAKIKQILRQWGRTHLTYQFHHIWDLILILIPTTRRRRHQLSHQITLINVNIMQSIVVYFYTSKPAPQLAGRYVKITMTRSWKWNW